MGGVSYFTTPRGKMVEDAKKQNQTQESTAPVSVKSEEQLAQERAKREEERQRTIESLANKFCEGRQGEYAYGYWICGGCVNLDSIINLFESSGQVTITNAEAPPAEESCKRVAELCLQVWGEKDCTNVAEQKLWIGMTDSQLYVSMGVPKDKNNTVGTWGTHSQWVYGDFGPYVYLEGKSRDDLVVTSWQD